MKVIFLIEKGDDMVICICLHYSTEDEASQSPQNHNAALQ